MVTKKQIADAIAKFIENDLIENIEDKQLKLVLYMAKHTLKDNPDVLDSFLDNPIIAVIMSDSDEEYNVDNFLYIMKKITEEYSSYPIEIPAIPLLFPKSKLLKINSSDLEKISMYIKKPSLTAEVEVVA